MIRDLNKYKISETYNKGYPFKHVVIDDFFLPEVADKLSEEFPDYNDTSLNNLNNPLENKKSNNHWDRFPSCTYRAFMELGKEKFLDFMKVLSDSNDLVLDYGLNGGGWHMHGRGGNNNVHLDYNLHPKM